LSYLKVSNLAPAGFYSKTTSLLELSISGNLTPLKY